MYTAKDGVRFATPVEVAQYRAERLQCNTLAEIGCGIGGQTIHFARMCEKVYAVEIDRSKLNSAKKNCREHGLDNVVFVLGDALSRDVIDKIPEIDILFSDPRRPAMESQRKVTSLEPGLSDMMKAYSSKTTNFVFEAPPKLTPERVQFNCEKEYISLDGQLNRLTLYFGDMKQAEVSALKLPENIRLNCDSQKREPEIQITSDILAYASEPDPSVVQAGLMPELFHDLSLSTGTEPKLVNIDKKRMLITSNTPLNHPMMKNKYKVIYKDKLDLDHVNMYLRDMGVKQVVLRAGIAPEQYWDVRNRLEEGLSDTKNNGDKVVHLFVMDDIGIICEKI